MSFPVSSHGKRAARCHRRSKRTLGRRATTRARHGLSLVETAALISLAGVLMAAFAPTFLRHLRMSKLSEAVQTLDALHRAAAAYYAEDRVIDGKRVRGCLPPSVGPIPEKPEAEPQEVDFDAPDTDPVWRALGMSGQVPLRFSYRVIVAQPGCGPRNEPASPAVVFQANGDLDGDGVQSHLERAAALSQDQRSLEVLGPLHMQQQVE